MGGESSLTVRAMFATTLETHGCRVPPRHAVSVQRGECQQITAIMVWKRQDWQSLGKSMANREWRTSYANHLVKMLKGEEPSAFAMVPHHAQGKGHTLEYLVEYALAYGRLPGRSQTWSNVLVPKSGVVVDEAELDVLMLHERGVFVFESKNYSGWIFGSERQRMWTQSLNKATKTRFYNPILQNATHVRALSERLVVPEEHFVSYIVFSNRCELKKVPSGGGGYRICHRDDLLRLVREDLGRRPVCFNGLQYSTIAERIEELAIASTDLAKEFHRQDVQMATSGSVCPRCGAKLVHRNGRHGAFMGCSNYPRCRFTRSVTQGDGGE